MNQDEDGLICYCGLYGGTCSRWRGHKTFRDLASILLQCFDSHGFQHWMPQQAQEFDYDQFRRGLEFFSREDSWIVCDRCCPRGGGRPDCEIRERCRQRRLDICFDCPDFPCAKTQQRPEMMEQAEKYRRLGRQRWIELQSKKAQQGFEHHLRRFVSVRVGEQPLE